MDTRTPVILLGTLVTLAGIAVHVYARTRFRTAAAPGLWPQISPSRWQPRRDWFTSDRGYRLSRTGAAIISIGGLIALLGSFL